MILNGEEQSRGSPGQPSASDAGTTAGEDVLSTRLSELARLEEPQLSRPQ